MTRLWRFSSNRRSLGVSNGLLGADDEVFLFSSFQLLLLFPPGSLHFLVSKKENSIIEARETIKFIVHLGYFLAEATVLLLVENHGAKDGNRGISQ